MAIEALAGAFVDTAGYDPALLQTGDDGRCDPVAPGKGVRMTDWHHLAAPFDHTLSDDFRAFLHAHGWLPLQAALALPAEDGR